MVEDVSGQQFYKACGDLLEGLVNHRVVHNGQSELIQQMNNCAAKVNDSAWRIIKRKSAGDISAPIGLAARVPLLLRCHYLHRGIHRFCLFLKYWTLLRLMPSSEAISRSSHPSLKYKRRTRLPSRCASSVLVSLPTFIRTSTRDPCPSRTGRTPSSRILGCPRT